MKDATHVKELICADKLLKNKVNDPKFYYNVLGCTSEASKSDLKTAYKPTLLVFHPDKCVRMSPYLSNVAVEMVYNISDECRQKKS